MRWYLDTSVGLHAVLPEGSVEAQAWRQDVLRSQDEVASCALLRLETVRTLRRDGLDRRHADWLLDRVEMLHLSQAALNVAESVERHIKSLDAIHLATAMLDGGAVTVVTHDRTMGEVAEHLGFETFDPPEVSRAMTLTGLRAAMP
ncbi:MAG: PIN domain-containing protein [Nesterenkonia sp.]